MVFPAAMEPVLAVLRSAFIRVQSWLTSMGLPPIIRAGIPRGVIGGEGAAGPFNHLK